ncbi:5-(carboxyamino)imidazole ribonucleotide synthase [Parapedomonas caeni]
MTPLPPGSTIGILGGGQLGRMLALAAAELGYRCHIYTPEHDSPASHVAAATTIAAYEDETALTGFATSVDIVTYEFENVPAATAALLAGLTLVAPSATVLGVAQDRVREKDFVAALPGSVPPYRAVASLAELEAAVAEIGAPAILKTRRMGYDGKGQARLKTAADCAEAWAALRGVPAILEGFVPFEREVSVLVVRGWNGDMAHYGPVENSHDDGILSVSRVPATVSPAVTEQAVALARRIAGALDYVGVLGVEMFVVGDTVLFNEMAPRVHNSGHWTTEGAVVSQFENHIRAICGLPLGCTDTVGRVEMRNLIGEDALRWHDLLSDPQARLHLYGKADARPGRKMGHVTYVQRD